MIRLTMFALAVLAHEVQLNTSPWLVVLAGLGALLIVAILAGLWWARRRLPPETEDGPEG